MKSILDEARLLVEPMLHAVVEKLPAEILEVAGFHFGWCDIDGGKDPRAGGKAVRPALTFACARAVGGSVRPAVPAAAAVELVHNFSLLHDDIMDGDITRRHRPTAWAAFGVPRALLAGDALFVLAVDLISSGTAGQALRAALLQMCAGQSDDLAFENRADVALPQCIRMAENKTGALFSLACQLGALSAADDIALAEEYRKFGRHLGIGFQLIDDVLGIWGHESVTGKPVYSDLKSRKKSLPVVAALSSGTPAGRKLAALYQRTAVLSEHELGQAADLVEEAGGRAWAEAQAARYRANALEVLAAAEPEQRGAMELQALADLVTARMS
ncbi:polyprenyl synthetase family protein [Mycobacterium simiae]|uniref:Polyprenyl synthetase family protein n=2 Tax=Mycobacterium simiae TaxID=1784 RepID=A0A5B1BM70_MYCSI|nr:polyprenyl synthetase family protein [Mycobacterium simiae]